MKTKKIWKIPTAKQYEAQMGIQTADQRKRILGHLQGMMRIVRAVLKRNEEAYSCAKPPGRPICESCGFRPEMRRRGGFLATAHGIMRQVLNQKPFLCHSNQPGWKRDNEIDMKRMMICIGFSLVADDPSVKRAAKIASEQIDEVLVKTRQEAS